MRGYGMPQASFADESHAEQCAEAVGMTPLAYRWQNLMKPGYVDGFSKNELYEDSYRQCMEKGMKAIGYEEKVKAYANQTGPIRRGIGLATFWYNTAVFPISLETSSCRLQLNLDGTVNLQVGETEIGQGADTAYAQMCAEILGLSDYKKGTRSVLSGHRRDPDGPRRIRLPSDLYGGLLHPADIRDAEAEDPRIRLRAHAAGYL